MSERKNLDKLFQEKFKDFEAIAPESAWPYIEEKLREKKKKRVIPIWWKLSGIAAALLIGFALYDGLFTHERHSENNIVIHENPNLAPLKDKMNPESHTKDSAVAGVESKNPDKINHNSGEVNTVTPNKNEVAVTLESDKKPSNSNAAQIESESGISQKQQIAVTESSTQKSGKDATGNFNRINAIKKENGIAGNSDDFGKSFRKKTKLGKAQRIMVQKNPFLTPKTKYQNQSDIKRDNTNSDSKLAQQNTAKIKTGADKNTNSDTKIAQQNTADLKSTTDKSGNTPINNQQPIANNEKKNEDKSPDKKLDSTAIATVVPNALEELLHEKENNLVTKGTRINRWQITSSVAPIYFGSASGGSPIDSAFTGNSKSYKTNLSVRLGVNYTINKKFTVRAGISQVTLDYNTNDVLISAGFQRDPLGNVNTTEENQFLHFGKKASLKNAAVAEPNTLSTDEFSSSINQKMGYIEVPVELSYAVIDQKFGLNIIGGVSTLFLNENKIVVVSDGLTTDLGEANNLSKTHFSTNVGLGMRYRFFKAFQANFEPMFKYQLNTFSKDAGNFKPYYFGLYTGLIFSF